jgi:hypothetical protein
MGARLRFAKVIDKELFYVKEKGRVHPSLESRVVLRGEPGTAGAFLVIRGWADDHGTFTERWKLQGPGGMTIYESTPREIHIATNSRTEHLQDEISDLELDAADDDYNVVFFLDEHEVGRVQFPVKLDGPR